LGYLLATYIVAHFGAKHNPLSKYQHYPSVASHLGSLDSKSSCLDSRDKQERLSARGTSADCLGQRGECIGGDTAYDNIWTICALL